MAFHAIRSLGVVLPAHGSVEARVFISAGVFAHTGTGESSQRIGLRHSTRPPLSGTEVVDGDALLWSRRFGRADPGTLPFGRSVCFVGGRVGGVGADGATSAGVGLFQGASVFAAGKGAGRTQRSDHAWC